MPKLEAKSIYQEIESGRFRPVYWLYGTERMKAREVLKRVRKAVLGENPNSLNEEILDGTSIDASVITEAAQTLSFGGGVKLIVVREAHFLKELERELPHLIGDAGGQTVEKDKLASICVFLSKDLDLRKKLSKSLVEKAAVVPCEEVLEDEKEAWISFLAKRRQLNINQKDVLRLRTLDPWNLDIVDQELEKIFLLATEDSEDEAQCPINDGKTADSFVEAFFSRDLVQSLRLVELFAESPEESLPLLGLLSWNLRQLVARPIKTNPYLQQRLNQWSRKWNKEELIVLQNDLSLLDHTLKQTPKLPLGTWTTLVINYCR